MAGLCSCRIAIPHHITCNPLGDINGDGASAVGRWCNAQGVGGIPITASEGAFGAASNGDIRGGEAVDGFREIDGDENITGGDRIGDVIADRQRWGCGVEGLARLNCSCVGVACQIGGNPLGYVNGDAAGAVGRGCDREGVGGITITATERSLAAASNGDVTCAEAVDRF